MEERKKVILSVVIFLVVVAVIVAVYFLFIRDKSEETQPVQEVAEETTPSEETIKEAEPVDFLQVELDESDELIRQLANALSSHPQLARWLMTKDLIRKFTAAVDSIANGQSPRPQVTFFSPRGKFQAVEKDSLYYTPDPESYRRYNRVANVFSSLDSEGCAQLFRRSKPVIQEAYQDLGYPDENFQKTLTKAIVELLKVPAVEGEILLEKGVVSYVFADPELENLSQTQKHLLRMGPNNVRKIQSKLREMALALGIPETELPQQ